MNNQKCSIHHVGYLVKDINGKISSFEGLEYVVENEIAFDEFRDV